MFNFVLSLECWIQLFNSRIVRTHFASTMTLNLEVGSSMYAMLCLVILVCVICELFLNRGYSFIVPGCIISGMGIIVFLFLVVGEFSPFSCPKFIMIYSG